MLIIVIIILILAEVISIYTVQTAKSVQESRSVIQARLAADTGIERTKFFLLNDPLWSNGEASEGPVDETSEVSKVTIEHNIDGTVVITSVGRCYNVTKTVKAVIKTGVVSLISSYGGGIKQLSRNPLELSGSSVINSNILINGDFTVWGSASVGLPGEERTVYANGSVYTNKEHVINGNVYAAGWAYNDAATGQVVSNWVPPVEFPQIDELSTLIELARSAAQTEGKASGKQHYFLSNKTFTENDLENTEGIYFVEGNAYIQSSSTNARVTIAASGNIYVTGSLWAENLVLMAGNSINFTNSSNTSIALAAAVKDIGWGNTGGGNSTLTLKYGVLAAGTVNGGRIRGSVFLEQNNGINFNLLAAPIHTLQIISNAEVE